MVSGSLKEYGSRLRSGLLAGLAAWFAGWLASVPFELVVGWRYVDAHARLLPEALGKGLFLVWGAFTFLMGAVGFFLLVLPLILLVPPAWIVRWRRILIPIAPLAAMVAVDRRMGFLNVYNLRHSVYMRAFFLTGPNFFVIAFGLTVVWVYSALAKRRLERK